MKWRKISNYCIAADGGYKIAVFHGEHDLYLLSYQGESLSWHKQSSEAKRAAQDHKGAA